MKKIILLFSLTALVIISNAQVQFGPKAGLNLSTVGGDDVDGDDVKMKAGIHVGFIVLIPVARQFVFQPEVVFSMQGYKDADDDDEKVNLGYINIPLLGKFVTTSGFFVETGPQIGLLVLAKSLDGDDSEDIKEFMKKTEFAWAFGLGFQTKSNFGINARYNLGISKIFDDGDAKVMNRVFQVGFFYLLGNRNSR